MINAIKLDNYRFDFNYEDENCSILLADVLRKLSLDNPVYLCIGFDMVVFDCLGPKVGTRLKERSNDSLVVYGVEGDTVNWKNLQEVYQTVKSNHPQSKIIVIDAASGHSSCGYKLGRIVVKNGGARPGSGVGKPTSEIGDIAILCNTLFDFFTPEFEELPEDCISKAADVIADAILLSANSSTENKKLCVI